VLEVAAKERVMTDLKKTDRCPQCSASPLHGLTLYIDPTGPFHGCEECGWVEPHGPAWTTEMVLRLFKTKGKQ
jgi:rubredoxin